MTMKLVHYCKLDKGIPSNEKINMTELSGPYWFSRNNWVPTILCQAQPCTISMHTPMMIIGDYFKMSLLCVHACVQNACVWPLCKHSQNNMEYIVHGSEIRPHSKNKTYLGQMLMFQYLLQRKFNSCCPLTEWVGKILCIYVADG